MGRGKPSLATTVNPDEIVYSGEELGNIPNFLLPDEKGNETLGIIVDQFGYNLSRLKDCYKKEKDENGIEKVVHYRKWEDIKYTGTFEAAYMEYIKLIIKRKDSQLKKARDLKEIVAIRKEIRDMVAKQLPTFVSDSEKEVLDLLKQKDTIKYCITELTKELEEMEPEVEKIRKAIKNAKKAKKYTKMEEE